MIDDKLYPLGNGEILIRQTCCGLNFDDLLVTQGQITNPDPIGIMGTEGVGIVEEIGPNCVRKFQKGQRVCYCTYKPGAFTTVRAVDENYLIPIPDDIPNDIAATCFKGLVAHMLLFRVYRSLKGHKIVIAGAAGALGSVLTQWATRTGIEVIAVTGEMSKKDYIMGNGARHVFNWKDEDVVKQIMSVTNKQGANAVYDGIGESFFPSSLKSLAPLGIWINYGFTSGEVKGFRLKHLQAKSTFATKPTVGVYKGHPMEATFTILEYFQQISKGALRPSIVKYQMDNVEQAIQDIAASKRNGQKILLV